MKSLRGSAGKRAAALLQTSDFQWIPTLWHFNKTLCHIASVQFGKRLKWRISSWLAGTFGQPEIWSTHLSSSWKHPAIPYEVLIDPLSMPNPKVLNMETHANSCGKTDDGGDTKVSHVVNEDALNFQMVNWTVLVVYFAAKDVKSVLMSSNYTTSRRVRTSTTAPQTCRWNTRHGCKHDLWGTSNLCIQGSVHSRLCWANKLSTCTPSKGFGYLGFTNRRKSHPPVRPYWFMPATQSSWSQLRKRKPYWSQSGNWVNPASSLIKPRKPRQCPSGLFNNRHQLKQWNCTDFLLRLQEHPGWFLQDLHLLTEDTKKLSSLFFKAASQNCLICILQQTHLSSCHNTMLCSPHLTQRGLVIRREIWIFFGWRDSVHVQEWPIEGEAVNIFTVPRGNS